MKNKFIKIQCIIALSAFTLMLTACNKSDRNATDAYEQYYTKNEYNNEDSYRNENDKDGDVTIMSSSKSDGKNVDTDPTSITVLVNKTYTLSEDYIPDDLVIPDIDFGYSDNEEKKYLRKPAADAITKLFDAAKEEGFSLSGVSGYRSYKRQFEIYASNLIKRGADKTNLYSAMAGSSEHQTGLAIDVSSKTVGYELSDNFANTPEGKWLSDHCYKYGFIIRYPKDKTNITGYAYEPWHIRYVGVELATYLTKHNLTLDEYYGYSLDPDIYANMDYDAIIEEYYEMKGIHIKPNTSTSSGNGTLPDNIEQIIDQDSNIADSSDEEESATPEITEPTKETEESSVSNEITPSPEETTKPSTPTKEPSKPTEGTKPNTNKPTQEVKPETTKKPTTNSKPDSNNKPTSNNKPDSNSKPDSNNKPETKPESQTEVKPSVKPTPEITPETKPTPEITPETKPSPETKPEKPSVPTEETSTPTVDAEEAKEEPES